MVFQHPEKRTYGILSFHPQRNAGFTATLPIQYIDYAIWQRNFLNSDAIQNKIDYWKAKLQNVSPLQLPTDFARPPVQSNNGNSYRFSIDNSLVSQLRELGQ
jgi:hypothetical protein